MRAAFGLATATSLMLATVGTAGVASAATAVSYETRADFIYRLDMQLGIKPVYPATPTFKDVAARSPYYGYIEAAYQAGITNGFSNGTFGPSLPLTRAEAAKYEVIADGQGNAAASITTTMFTDNAQIPTALVGYVAAANKLGLLKGFPNGAFQPNANLTTAQEQHLLTQLAAVMGSSGATTSTYTVKVTATPADVSPGQFVTLSALVTDASGAAVAVPVTYTVAGTNAAEAIVSGSSFVASQPGTYAVQATAGSAKGTATIEVYGSATGLKISAPTAIVANGSASSKVTVTFVDASGNVVMNDDSSVTLQTSNASAVGVMSGSVSTSSATATAVAGVATFTVVGGSLPGSIATLTATSGSLTASATVTTATQKASSLSVVPASPYLAVNAAGTTQTLYVKVLDQSGQPMVYGTFPFTISISGPATFPGGGTSAESYVYSGTGVNSQGTPVTIQDVQGSTGTITVTASATGLQSASGTITAVVAGAPSAIQIMPPGTTSFSADNGGVGLQFGLAIVDSHGYPVESGHSVLITVKNSQGQVATNIHVDGFAQTTNSGAIDPNAVTNGRFTVTDTGAGPDAGTYTVQATDPSGVLAPSTDVTFTETAGVAKVIQLAAPQFISAATPTATFTVQVTDAYGNHVALSGIPVTFASTSSGINPATQTIGTNASGQAQATFSVPGYVGSTYAVTASASLAGQSYTTTPVSFTVESTTAKTVAVQLEDNSTGTYDGSSAMAQSGDQVKVIIKATDQYGNQVPTSDKVLVSMSGTGSLTNWSTAVLGGGGIGNVVANANGTYTVTLIGGQAVLAAAAGASGTVTVQATDQSVLPSASGGATIGVQPGQVAGFGVFDSAGNLASSESVAANTPGMFTVKAVDVSGNPAIPVMNFLVLLQSSQAGGQFRAGSASGANLGATQGVLVSPGSGGVALYYVTGTAQTGVDLTATDWVGYPAGVGENNAGALVVQNGGSIVFSTNASGTLADTTTPGNVTGTTFTAPASGSGTDTLALEVGGNAVLTFQVSW